MYLPWEKVIKLAESSQSVISTGHHSPWALPLSASLSLSPAGCCSWWAWARLLHSLFSISTSTPTSTHKAELLLQLLRPSFERPFERHSAEIRHVLLEIRGATILPKLIDLATSTIVYI